MSTQVEANKGWEERFNAIREHTTGEPILFYPHTLLSELETRGLITHSEWMRATRKMHLIRPFVQKMVLNMLKGTVKYSHDNWSTETWHEMSTDDKVDSINYDLLLWDHLLRTGKL